jgi:hypothetical protein
LRRPLSRWLACVGVAVAAHAPSAWATLGAHDVAIVRVNSSVDGFSVLALRDLARTEALYWTDDGWTQANAFRAGEGSGTQDVLAQDVPCGSVFDVPASSLSGDGDQVFLFTGTLAAPSLLWGVDWGNASGWNEDASDANTSADPAVTGGGLSDSQTVSLSSYDSHRYTGGRTGTVTEITAWVADPANWTAVASTNWGEARFSVSVPYAREGRAQNPGVPVAAGIVSALATNAAVAVPVFRFTLTDSGAGDGLPLKVLQLCFEPTAANTARWTGTLAGFVLSNATDAVLVPVGAAWITDAFAALPIPAGALEVPDGGSKELCLYAFWRSSGVEDDAVVAFRIAASSHGCVAIGDGSSAFACDFGSAVVGHPQTIAVTATELRFVSVPSHSETDRAFGVTVCACDAAGNADTGVTVSVSLGLAAGGGTLSGASNLSLTGGSNRWTSLRYEAGGVFALRATCAGLADGVSPDINAVVARLTLTGGVHRIGFDTLTASGLPDGVLVYTNAGPDSVGTMVTFDPAKKAWNDSAGAFKNVASTSGLASDSSSVEQGGSADRALGLRQSGAFGDPGAAIVVGVRNAVGFEDLTVSMDLLMLAVSSRSTVWTLDYRIGDSGAFTSLHVWDDPGEWGGTRISSCLPGTRNCRQPVYVRVVALDASTGSGSRDTVAVDNIEFACRRIPDGTVLVFR